MFEPLGASGCVREVRSLCAVRNELRGRSVPNRESNPIRLQLQQSHRFTRHRSCGVWHLHLLHCCPAPGAVCWVCRRPGGGGSAQRADSFRALQQAFVDVVVGSAQSSVSHRRSVAVCDHLARARARTRGSNFEMSHPIEIGPVAVGPPQALGRTCAGAGGSRCRDV